MNFNRANGLEFISLVSAWFNSQGYAVERTSCGEAVSGSTKTGDKIDALVSVSDPKFKDGIERRRCDIHMAKSNGELLGDTRVVVWRPILHDEQSEIPQISVERLLNTQIPLVGKPSLFGLTLSGIDVSSVKKLLYVAAAGDISYISRFLAAFPQLEEVVLEDINYRNPISTEIIGGQLDIFGIALTEGQKNSLRENGELELTTNILDRPVRWRFRSQDATEPAKDPGLFDIVVIKKPDDFGELSRGYHSDNFWRHVFHRIRPKGIITVNVASEPDPSLCLSPIARIYPSSQSHADKILSVAGSDDVAVYVVGG